MRRRFPLTTHFEFTDALASKRKYQEENPEGSYQIRKHKNGFKVVERLDTGESKVIQEKRSAKKSRRPGYTVL